MASTPRYKVFNPSGEYVAACKHVEDAACLVGFYGVGAQIRDGHTKVVWHEGREDQPASESYDHVFDVVSDRSARIANSRYSQCDHCGSTGHDTGSDTCPGPKAAGPC